MDEVVTGGKFLGQSTTVRVRMDKRHAGLFPRPSSGCTASLIPHNKDFNPP